MIIPSPRSNRKARIEIVPLIDIIFFLLATFVMVSMSMTRNQGISVNLPVAASGAQMDRAEYASITLAANGDYFFNKEAMSFAQLIERLRTWKTGQAEPRVFINGDAGADFGNVVAVLDEVRRLGIARVAIETRKP